MFKISVLYLSDTYDFHFREGTGLIFRVVRHSSDGEVSEMLMENVPLNVKKLLKKKLEDESID